MFEHKYCNAYTTHKYNIENGKEEEEKVLHTRYPKYRRER